MNQSQQIIEALYLMERAKVAFTFKGQSGRRMVAPVAGGVPVYISDTLIQAASLHLENSGGDVMRGLSVEGNHYSWDAELLIHNDVIRTLDKKGGVIDFGRKDFRAGSIIPWGAILNSKKVIINNSFWKEYQANPSPKFFRGFRVGSGNTDQLDAA